MSDLQNKFPSWGESGTLPPSGFFYEGGNQVNEKHLDALWHNVKIQNDQLIQGIRDRVREITGDVILDGGMSVSQGSNTREVDITSSSNGAYVDGQKTGGTSSTTVTLSDNSTTSTRTDSIWVDAVGQIGSTEGASSVSDSEMKIAEVDVASDGSISTVRDTGRHRSRTFAADNIDAGQIIGGVRPGDLWLDSDESHLKGRVGGGWNKIAVDGQVGSFTFDGSVEIATGQLSEQGNRVATRTWATSGNINHAELGSISSDDHHTKTQTSDVNSANWGDYEIQKNGTDGNGIINFKT